MVAINSRLKPEFHRDYPLPWLPGRRIWQVVLGAYVTLTVWHLVQANLLMGLLCSGVVVATSPRLRASVSGAVGRIVRGTKQRSR